MTIDYKITGDTEVPPTYPLDETTIPTTTDVTIADNLATATDDDASLETWDYVAAGNVSKIASTLVTAPAITFTIDPSSTELSVKLNSSVSGLLSDNNSLLLEVAGDVGAYLTADVVETEIVTPDTVVFDVEGATDAPPTYAFNNTNVTVSNMTIAANQATATANGASATTLAYDAINEISEAQAVAILQPAELQIDPSSTTGNIKINYATNNLLQVGSKVILTDDGVTTEQTIDGGSQSSSSLISNTDGSLSFKYINDILFVLGTSTRRLLKSLDNGTTWQFLTTLGGSGSANINSGCFFNGKYYLGLTYGSNQSTVNLWESTDTITWQSGHSATFTDAGSCGVATNGAMLSVGYGTRLGSGSSNLIIYSSTDGAVFTLRNTYNPGTNTPIVDFKYVNGFFLCAAINVGSASNNGISWSNVNFDSVVAGNVSNIYYDGTNFVCSRTGGGTVNVYRSTSIGGPWISSFSTAASSNPNQIQFINNKFVFTCGNLIFSSSSLISGWSTATPGISGTFGFLSSTTNSIGRYVSGNSGNVNMLTSNDYGAAWTSVNLATTTEIYQFTITSPSLPVPDATYLGGQVLQSNIGAAGWTTHTVTYSDNSGAITFSGNNHTGLTGTTAQVRMTNVNNTEILSKLSAILETEEVTGYQYTCSDFTPALSEAPEDYAAKWEVELSSSVSVTDTPSYTVDNPTSFTRDINEITVVYEERDVTGTHVMLKVEGLNNGDIVSMIGAGLSVTTPTPTPTPSYSLNGGINLNMLVTVNSTVVRRG